MENEFKEPKQNHKESSESTPQDWMAQHAKLMQDIEKNKYYIKAMDLKYEASKLFCYVSNHLNLDRIKTSSKIVLDISEELRALEPIFEKHPERIPDYEKTLMKLLRRGQKELDTLYDRLKKAKVFELLVLLAEYKEELRKSGKEDNLPTSETEFLHRIGFSKDEIEWALYLIPKYQTGEYPSFENILGKYLKNVAENLQSKGLHMDKTTIWPMAKSVSRICAGLGLIGLNIGTYSLGPEVVITYVQMTQSCLTGWNITASGIPNEWINKRFPKKPEHEIDGKLGGFPE